MHPSCHFPSLPGRWRVASVRKKRRQKHYHTLTGKCMTEKSKTCYFVWLCWFVCDAILSHTSRRPVRWPCVCVCVCVCKTGCRVIITWQRKHTAPWGVAGTFEPNIAQSNTCDRYKLTEPTVLDLKMSPMFFSLTFPTKCTTSWMHVHYINTSPHTLLKSSNCSEFHIFCDPRNLQIKFKCRSGYMNNMLFGQHKDLHNYCQDRFRKLY